MGRPRKNTSTSVAAGAAVEVGKKISLTVPKDLFFIISILREEQERSFNDIIIEMMRNDAKRRRKEIQKSLDKIFGVSAENGNEEAKEETAE